MKKTVLFFATLLFALAAFAYPIRPRPLRQLVMESHYIIQGIVLETGELPPAKKNELSWNRDFARILVKEVWQGAILSDTITVYYTARLLCPAPAVYTKGAEMIAFLDKPEKGDGYETHALSYGVKYEGLSVYKTRIAEIQQILKIKNVQEQEEKILAWLVECALDPSTRWEGVYELMGGDLLSLYDRNDRVCKNVLLGTAQLNRLFNALLATDTLNYQSDLILADIVRGVNDESLLDFLKSRLARVDEQNLWQAFGIMLRIVRLTGNNELEGLYQQFSKTVFEFTKEKKDESKIILSSFISKMQAAGLKQTIAAGNNAVV